MTALSLGASAPLRVGQPLFSTAQACASSLTLHRTDTGFIVYRDSKPLAWVYQGYHSGQINNQPTTCRFVDVAYHRQTQHGVNLETRDFTNMQDAMDFVLETFGGAA